MRQAGAVEEICRAPCPVAVGPLSLTTLNLGFLNSSGHQALQFLALSEGHRFRLSEGRNVCLQLLYGGHAHYGH